MDDEDDPSAFEEELAMMEDLENEMHQDMKGIKWNVSIISYIFPHIQLHHCKILLTCITESLFDMVPMDVLHALSIF